MTVDLAGRGNQSAELTRHLIVLRERELSSRDRHLLPMYWIVRGLSRLLFGHAKRMRRGVRFLYPRTAEYDDGRPHSLFTLDQLGLEKFKTDANGAEFFPLEKFCVEKGRDVGWGRDVRLKVVGRAIG